MNRVRAVLPFVLVLVGTAVLADAATVATPTFDKKHGFYDSGFSVRISTGTAGATIRYTTDGSKPTASYGTVLANGGTVSIGTTTCLRAVGCAGGMTTSRILTQTYIFLNDVIKQKRPSGYPSAFGTVAGDYDMDPDIVNNSSYSGTIKDDLKAIPSLSLVAGKNEWFGTGFFNGGGGSGGQNTKEIGVSAELIYADSRPGFQIDAGLKTHSWARSKRSLRLLFKTTYGGPSTLNYPFFESAPHHSGSAANTFGKIFLRGGGNDCWTGGWYTDGRDVTYIKDQWARDTQTALSGSGSRGTFMHLYINGLYWGLYNPVERPDARFAATYFGGSKGDYFAGNQGSDSFGAVSGSESRFTYMINTLAKQDLSVAANYDKMKQYLDLNHYIDYIITWWYMGGGDWVEGNQPNYSYQYVNNYYVGNRNSGPVKYYIWDGETAWVDSSGTSRPGRMNAGAWVKPQFVEYYSDSKHHWMARPFRALWKNKDFRDLWAQRVYQHCYNGGALTDANARARWSTLASRVDKAMVAESARWGDHKRDYSNSSCPVFNRNTHFRNARNYVLGLMSGNVDRFIKALRAKSLHGYPLYPATHPGGSAPSAPSSLAASATSSTAVTLTWQDNSSNETAFKIDRSTDGSTWSRIKETGSNVTTYTDSGLAAGQKYYYRVKASNSVGDSGYSNVASATTSQNVPAAPSGATASATSSTAITITWTDNSSNETGFKLDRRQSGTDAWVRITQTGANVTRYTDSGLSAGTQYYYMVKATSSAGDSDYSNVAAATTAEGLPAQPSGVAATALSTTQIKLTWQDNSSNETQFKIRRSLDGVDFDTLEPVYAAANATTLTDSGLTPGTTYSYKMRSENAAGVSAYTTPVSATTQLGVPAAPSDLTATAASASRVDLTWKDSSSNETGFKLDRRQSGTDSWVRIAEPAAGTTAYSDTGLAAGTHYYYMVKAYNAAGNSAYSGVAAATTDEGLPAQPAGVAAAAVSETEIRLTWTDTSSNETQFKIRRSLDGIDFYVLDPLYAAADATSVTDSGLTPGTTYHYMMRSENAAGVSAYTTPVSATTQLGVPAAPSGLTATAVSSSGIDLSWTDSSSNETAFKIDRRESGTTLWVRVAEPAAGVTGYSDVGLPADTHFYYKVKA
ncbi:MAG: fibronectin type III domain-containing protein, partial [Kiritimatiellae bacterium]|nr:fibronectin type III domain-containing protein [Kiritimatiellia bacterium]